jgi:hypothetical protein
MRRSDTYQRRRVELWIRAVRKMDRETLKCSLGGCAVREPGVAQPVGGGRRAADATVSCAAADTAPQFRRSFTGRERAFSPT